MEPACRILIAAALLGSSVALGQNTEPTKQEIAQAYRSKRGEGDTLIPGVRWEMWRIKEIRGWSLRFKRVSENRGVGILTREYRAVARKNGSCAEYRITDTIIFPPSNVQMPPMPIVEPGGVRPCR